MQIKKSDFLLLPNLLTLFRLFLLPFAFYFLLRKTNSGLIVAIILLGVAYFSDMLDGYLARKLNQISDLGKILDPTVDKIIIALLAIYLTVHHGFPMWVLVLILAEYLAITLGAVILIKKQKEVPTPKLFGKYAVSILGIVLFFYLINLTFWKEVFLWIGAGMILITSFTYMRMFILKLKK
jgi:cardiolipin synthase (CMP-forming)